MSAKKSTDARRLESLLKEQSGVELKELEEAENINQLILASRWRFLLFSFSSVLSICVLMAFAAVA